MSKLQTYGLSPHDLQEAKNKIARQKDYLESLNFTNDETGEVKSLLDYSYSANISKRYYPRILNKVHTFVSFNEARGYTPIFLTVTLDGFFRDFLYADYSRFRGDIKHNYINGKHIPNNDRMGYYLDHIEQGRRFTPKDLYKVLGWQLHRFIRSGTLQNIRKEGFDYSMIRVTEPHKDGVPHLHILLYVPDQYVKSVFKEFKKFFPAPQNHKLINLKQDNRNPVLMFDNQYETKGFQTEIRSPAGYLLKYILKSFRNLVEGHELDYLQAWYIHNRIPRIITTHTLISQDIYHHASLLDDDWFYLSEIKHHGIVEKDNIFNTFHLVSDRDRELIYQNGFYQLVNKGYIVKEFGENKLKKFKFTVDRPIAYIKKEFLLKDCIFSTANTRYWCLVPKRKKYFYNIRYIDRFIEVDIDDNLMYFDRSTGELLDIELIELDDSLYIRSSFSTPTQKYGSYKHSFRGSDYG